MKFANLRISWFNWIMKNLNVTIKDKILSRYSEKDLENTQPSTSNINVLLNRIKVNKKNETRKKLYFSAAASTGLILFGFILF